MDDATLTRFRKICGLLGSDQVGERAAAGTKATEMLRAAGLTWDGIGVNGNATSPKLADLAEWMGQAKMWRGMLDDERRRTTMLANQLREAKRALEKLQGGNGAAPPSAPKLSKRQRRQEKLAKRAAQREQRSDDPDAELRRHVSEVLAEYDAGDLHMSERTLEFLRSVDRQARWTDKQREAVERTLTWVSAGRKVA